MECFICGTKGEKKVLFSAIVREGVVKICEDCSVKESIPIIKRVSDLQLKESEKNQTVYEKLSKMAGIDPKEHKAKFGAIIRKKDENLRKIVEEKAELSFPNLKQAKPETKDDLIRNYHWVIFKARRARRLTQVQLAEAISEPEASIKLIERGVLPDDYHPFIRKLQTYLGVTIFSKPVRKQLGFDKISSKELTISDLQEIKDKVEEEKSSSFFPYWRKKLGFLKKKREEKKEEEELEELGLEDETKSPEEEEGPEDVAPEEIKRVLENSKEEKSESSKEERGLTQEEMDEIIFGNEKF